MSSLSLVDAGYTGLGLCPFVAGPQGSILVSDGHQLRLIDVKSGYVRYSWPYFGQITAIASSQDGSIGAVAVVNADGGVDVTVLSLISKEVVQNLVGVTDLSVTALAVSANADRIAAAGSVPEHKLYVWDVSTGEMLAGVNERLFGVVSKLTFSPASTSHITASGRNGLSIFSLAPTFESYEVKHTSVKLPLDAAVVPAVNGDELLLTARPVAYDEPTDSFLAQKFSQHNSWVDHAWYGEDHVVVSNVAGEVYVIAADTGKPERHTRVVDGENQAAMATQIAIVDSNIVAGCTDGVVRVFDAATLSLQGVMGLGAERVYLPLQGRYARLVGSSQLPPSDTHDELLVDGDVQDNSILVFVTLPNGSIFAATSASTFYEITQDGVLTAAGRGARAPGENGAVSLLAPSFIGHSRNLVGEVVVADANGANREAGKSTILTVDDGGFLRLWRLQEENCSLLGTGLFCNDIDGERLGSDNLLGISSIVTHRRLPLVALGMRSGHVVVISVNSSCDERTSAPFTLFHVERVHGHPVSSVAFTDDGSTGHHPYLSTLSSTEGAIALLDTRLFNKSGSAVFAVAQLPHASVLETETLPVPDAFECSSMAWCLDAAGAATLFIGSRSGHLLSLTIPHQAAMVLPTMPLDLTGAIRLRARFPCGISDMAAGFAAPFSSMETHEAAAAAVNVAAEIFVEAKRSASFDIVQVLNDRGALLVGPLGDGCLFATLDAEKTTAIVPYDGFHLAADPVPADLALYDNVPGGTSAVLSLLTAHKKACTAVAISPMADAHAGILLATAGSDGAVTLWAIQIAISLAPAGDDGMQSDTLAPVYGVQVTASTYTGLAALECKGLRFSPDGRTLTLSCVGSMTGRCLRINGDILDIVEGACAAVSPFGPRYSAAAITGPELAILKEINGPSDATAVRVVDNAAIPVLQKVRDWLTSTSTEHHVKIQQQLLGEVERFRTELQALLAANEAASPEEQLTLNELVVDEAGCALIRRRYEMEVEEKRNRFGDICRKMEEQIARIKHLCIEPMAAHACSIHGISNDGLLTNFPLRKRTDEETAHLRRVSLLRRVEQLDVNAAADANDGIWFGLADSISSTNDWIYHCGLLPPTSLISGHEDAKAKTAAAPKADKEKAAAANRAEDADAETGAQGEADAEAVDVEVQWELEAVIPLLYHPASVRTPFQKRSQLLLLRELLRATQFRFNEQFDKLQAEKLEVLESVTSRHARIRDILGDLGESVVHATAQEVLVGAQKKKVATTADAQRSSGSNKQKFILTQTVAASLMDRAGLPAKATVGPITQGSTSFLVDPFLLPDEVVGSELEARAEEIEVQPYVSEAERRRRQEEEDKRRREAEATKDDAPERALVEMMGGTLEGKDELEALQESLVREPWMDVLTDAQMSTEQKTALAVYQAKLAAVEEEKVKRRNALNAELTRLVQEVKEAVAAFDEKVSHLAKTRFAVVVALCAQELYMTQLGQSVQQREILGNKDRQLEQRFLALVPQEEATAASMEAFNQQITAQAARVEELTANDKHLEKSFRESIKEACGPLEPDVMRVVTTLFKRRGTSARAHSLSIQASGHDFETKTAEDLHDEAYLSRADCPDGYAGLADNTALWNKLISLRSGKLVAEADLHAAQTRLEHMKTHATRLAKTFEALKAQVDKIGGERDELARAREIAVNDPHFLIKLKMGQDEVVEDTSAEYTDAMLLPSDVIEGVNVEIRKRGGRKVDILTEIKDFRRNLLYMEWEREYLEASLADLGEYYRDLLLMRAMGTIGEYIKGVNVASKARKDADKASERLIYMRQAHQRLMKKLRQSHERLTVQLRERETEIDNLNKKRLDLEESVQMRDNILRSRKMPVDGTVVSAASERMQVVAAKSRLATVARAQGDEIISLTKELDRLRQRSFPAFPSTSFM